MSADVSVPDLAALSSGVPLREMDRLYGMA